MLLLLFIPLAVLASAACFYYGYTWMKIPFLWNIVGSVCAFVAVFCLGGAYPPSNGPWDYADDSSTNSAYSLSMQFLGLAVFAYVVGYIVRMQALKAGIITDADDEA